MVLAYHAVAIGYPSGTGNVLAIILEFVGYPSETGNGLKTTLEFVGRPLRTENELINNLFGEVSLSRLCQGVPWRE